MIWKLINSPFKFPKIKFYLGKVRMGVPYYTPRRWTKEGYEPKQIGYDIVRLGYKYKFDSIRFEWNPMFSFVFFGIQFCITLAPDNPDSYWESWLYYHKHTNKNDSTLKRLKQCIEEAPQRYVVWNNGNKSSVDYYQLNLRNKWVKQLY